MKIKHAAFTMYPVKNMKRARKFYEKVMGLKVGKNFNDAWVEYYPGGTSCFAITNMTPIKPSAKHGGSIAFEVANLDEAIKKLSKAKSKCLVKPYTTPVCRFAVYRDTEGNAVMIHAKTK